MKENYENKFTIIFVCVNLALLIYVVNGLMDYVGTYDDIYSSMLMDIILLFYIVICLIAAIFIQVIMHEMGHLIFGIITGYKLVHFQIGRKVFVGRKKNKDVLAQCLMVPKSSEPYSFYYILYNAGGNLMNLMMSIYVLLIMMNTNLNIFINVALFILSFVGIYFFILNGLPMIMNGIPNDAYTLLCIMYDNEARKAFWIYLNIVYEICSNKKRIGQLPEHWFTIETNSDFNNPYICLMKYYRCLYLIDKADASNVIESCYDAIKTAKRMGKIQLLELECEYYFFKLLTEKCEEKIDKDIIGDVKKIIDSDKKSYRSWRIRYAYELIIKKNTLKAAEILSQFEKMIVSGKEDPDCEYEYEKIMMAKRYYQ